MSPGKEPEQKPVHGKKGAGQDKRRLIVQGVIVLALVYLGMDQFLGEKTPAPNQSNQVVEKPSPPQPKTNSPPPAEPTTTAEEEPKSPEPPAPAPELAPESESAPAPEPAPPKQAEEDVAKVEESAEEPEPEKPEPRAEEVVEEAVDKKEELIESEPKVAEVVVEQEPEEEQQDLVQTESEAVPDILSWAAFLESVEINSELEYPPPADYESGGKGLVYNCRAGHWACVDRVSYLQCAQHQKKQLSQEQSPHCVIRQVYFSPNHCVRGQLASIHRRVLPEECGF